MEYIVCYDLSDDRRRDRLARTLLDYGRRIQESVFMMDLDDELHARMVARVRQVIVQDQDRVHIFSLCAACEKRVVTLGTAELPRDPEFVII